ncbi:hypothetical protein ACFO1B_39750 [Dactylosporangium siamense]|uniref:Uncharacterized protein n=1 Tax=Dactylosporangium siamense TaxID=685454 RepID=A0A919PWK3_9ACTN|nr:hypothetical protein [Dactylosporangium siamense]GIG49928.1 hypothetical protein Dsi01nite_079690 [Dactylosporangium siamense]
MSAGFTTATRQHDLEFAFLCLEAAVDLVPLISTVIEDHDGRVVVTRDVVDCWLALPIAMRAAYDIKRLPTAPSFTGRPPVPALSRFVGDYVDVIDESWIPDSVDPHAVDFDTGERLHRHAWRRHERQIRERLAAHRGPDEQFIRKLARPVDFTGDGWPSKT